MRILIKIVNKNVGNSQKITRRRFVRLESCRYTLTWFITAFKASLGGAPTYFGPPGVTSFGLMVEWATWLRFPTLSALY